MKARFMSAQTAAAIPQDAIDEIRQLRVSWIWLIAWVGLTALVGFEVATSGFIAGSPQYGGAPIMVAFGAFIAPDLAFLIGVGQQMEKGSISTTAVPFYNAAHRMTVAAVFTAAVAVGLAPPGRLSHIALVGGLSWMAHVAVDRAVGYGLRNPDSSRTPH